MKFKEFDTVTDADKGKEFEIIDPRTRKGVGSYITIAGPDSSIYQKATDELSRKLQENTTLLEFKTQRLIRCCLSWRLIFEDDEQKVPAAFNEAKVAEFFKYNTVVRDQFINIHDEKANFLK